MQYNITMIKQVIRYVQIFLSTNAHGTTNYIITELQFQADLQYLYLVRD